MVERLAVNEDVVGSIPTSGATNKNTPCGVFLLVFVVVGIEPERREFLRSLF